MRLVLLALLLPWSLHAVEVGDRAPSLGPVVWVQGESTLLGTVPVLVEFWATWCEPCREVALRLSELAKTQRAKLAVVGLTTEEATVVRDFLTEHGGDLTYPVGLVTVQVNQDWRGDDGAIPHAVVVGKDGVVLWQGHPLTLDRALPAILAGTWDLALAKRLAAAKRALREVLNAPPPKEGEERQLAQSILKATEPVLQLDPLDLSTISLRLGIARHLGEVDTLRATLQAVPVAELHADEAEALAREAVTEGDLRFRQLDWALVLAERAVTADPERADGHATLAKVRYALGMVEDAAASQDVAVALRPDDASLAADAAYYHQAATLAKDLRDGRSITAALVAAAPSLTRAGTASLTALASLTAAASATVASPIPDSRSRGLHQRR